MNENKGGIPIDLERIDAHVISEREYEEIPELTDEDFARGRWTPGRSSAASPSVSQHHLIHADILARFKATGPGWEDRINRILRDAADAIGVP